MSSRYLLTHLPSHSNHVAGYNRSLFKLWDDADGDGCDTREETLIAEAVIRPKVGSGCALTGGKWRSKYDGVTTTNPSLFDIDHMVPLDDAWRSGAWRWSAAKREAYANDLGYAADLIAVSAHSNRSKGDREPQDWMPQRKAYGCTYVAQWVAIKWRWGLSVNTAERTFIRAELRSCGWPRVPKPSRATIAVVGKPTNPAVPVVTPTPTPTPATSTQPTTVPVPSPTTSDAGPTTVGYAVHPGAFCSEHWSYGYTSAGTKMVCSTTSTDSRFRWRSA